MAVWKRRLRPYWSPSLPHSGVAAVDASRYAVTTQDRCSRPPRSLTMVGRAVETMVWSSAASSRPSSSAPIDSHTPPDTWSAPEPRRPPYRPGARAAYVPFPAPNGARPRPCGPPEVLVSPSIVIGVPRYGLSSPGGTSRSGARGRDCEEDLHNLWSSRGGTTRGPAERAPVPGMRCAQARRPHTDVRLRPPRRRRPPRHPHRRGGGRGGLRSPADTSVRRPARQQPGRHYSGRVAPGNEGDTLGVRDASGDGTGGAAADAAAGPGPHPAAGPGAHPEAAHPPRTADPPTPARGRLGRQLKAVRRRTRPRPRGTPRSRAPPRTADPPPPTRRPPTRRDRRKARRPTRGRPRPRGRLGRQLKAVRRRTRPRPPGHTPKPRTPPRTADPPPPTRRPPTRRDRRKARRPTRGRPRPRIGGRRRLRSGTRGRGHPTPR